MHISLEQPNQPAVIALIAELDAYQASLYPPESNHFIHIDALAQANVLFAVARNLERHAIGCGAIVLGNEFGEVKRMYVHPEQRGGGIATALHSFLEAEAMHRGCKVLMLETGISQPEALAFYARSGYTYRGPFGSYAADPLSVFMQKELGLELGLA